tara:strand:- start:574 stop:1311 length:738 start_codon:yes stop_codon:yes gene_type:complete
MVKNKSYIVLGAAGGIGSEVVKRLHDDGANLYIGSRSIEQSELVTLKNCHAKNLDARSFLEVEKFFMWAHEQAGEIHGIVNAIGSIYLKPADRTPEDNFINVIETNLKTAFATIRSGVSVLSENSSIVLFSTAASLTGIPNHEAIACAKGGINSLVMSASATYATKKIRVNAIAPGLVDTPATHSIISNELSRNASLKMHPIGRLGEVSDIIPSVMYLLSNESSWMTGQVIAIDGGLSNLRSKSK